MVTEDGFAKRVPIKAFPEGVVGRVGVIGCKVYFLRSLWERWTQQKLKYSLSTCLNSKEKKISWKFKKKESEKEQQQTGQGGNRSEKDC
jgi:hypothetical protein